MKKSFFVPLSTNKRHLLVNRLEEESALSREFASPAVFNGMENERKGGGTAVTDSTATTTTLEKAAHS